MVYSLENIRFLREELERLTDKSRQLERDLTELKLRAGLSPDEELARPEAEKKTRDQAVSPGFFSRRFRV